VRGPVRLSASIAPRQRSGIVASARRPWTLAAVLAVPLAGSGACDDRASTPMRDHERCAAQRPALLSASAMTTSVQRLVVLWFLTAWCGIPLDRDRNGLSQP